jgi:acetyl esterase/lipase
MFSAISMMSMVDEFVTPEEHDNYSEPIRADSDWWKETPVEKVLMLAGDHEMFRDDIVVFSGTLEKAGVDLNFVNCPLQVHVECHLDAQTGMEPGLMSTSIWDWLDTLF